MAARIALSLIAALLIAAPAAAGASTFRAADPGVDQPKSGGSDQQFRGNDQLGDNDQDGMSDAQNFALVAGQVLGAAAACEQINEQRVSTATKKAVKLATDTAESDQDVQTAQQYMLDAADSGRDAVKEGNADCDRVEDSFVQLEQIEQNTAKLQSQLDDPNTPAHRGKRSNKDSSGDQDDAE